MKKLLLLSTFTSLSIMVFGQEYKIPKTGKDTIYACEGIITDDGGLLNDYSSNADGYLTIIPSIENKIIKLTIPPKKFETWYSKLTFLYEDTLKSKSITFDEGKFSNEFVTLSNKINNPITINLKTSNNRYGFGLEMNIECIDSYPVYDLNAAALYINDTIIKDMIFRSNGRIENISNNQSNIYNVIHYISTDKILDKNEDFSLISESMYQLKANSSVHLLSDAGKFPNSLANGKYYIFRCLDGNDIFPESNKENNCSMDSTIALDAFYSIKATKITPINETISSENSLKFNYTAYNNGYIDITKTQVNLYISSSPKIEDSLFIVKSTLFSLKDGFESNGSITVDFSNKNLASGIYYAIVQFDPDSLIDEHIRSDNFASSTFSIDNSLPNNFNIKNLGTETYLINPSQFLKLDYSIENKAIPNIKDLSVNLKILDVDQINYSIDTIIPIILSKNIVNLDFKIDFNKLQLKNGNFDLVITLDPKGEKLEDASDNFFKIALTLNDTVKKAAILSPINGQLNITSCNETATDPGGQSGNYPNNSSGTINFSPDLEVGKLLSLDFTEIETENTWDKIEIYDNNILVKTLTGSISSFKYTATSNESILSIKMISDAAFNMSGYKVNVTCLIPLGTLKEEEKTDYFYPNPVIDYLNINPDYTNYNFSIYSLDGNKIGDYLSIDNKVNLSELSSGTYLIQNTNKNNVNAVKFIKK